VTPHYAPMQGAPALHRHHGGGGGGVGSWGWGSSSVELNVLGRTKAD
jgi:hypothetical protein